MGMIDAVKFISAAVLFYTLCFALTVAAFSVALGGWVL